MCKVRILASLSFLQHDATITTLEYPREFFEEKNFGIVEYPKMVCDANDTTDVGDDGRETVTRNREGNSPLLLFTCGFFVFTHMVASLSSP